MRTTTTPRHPLRLLISIMLLTTASLKAEVVIPTPVDGVLTIEVSVPGELAVDYPVADVQATGATTLKVIGPLNDSDFSYLKNVLSTTLTALDISEALFSTLPSEAFRNKTTLTAIALPDGLASISTRAFSGCSSLASITLPSALVNINNSAFYECSSLEAVHLPSKVLTIGSSAFQRCSSLGTVTLPDGLTTINSSIFEDCIALTNINLPESLTSIGGYAFSGCSSLASVNFPDNLTSIDSYTFNGCSSLSTIDLPSTLTSIGSSAFRNCSMLSDIKLPDHITSISSYTFSGCSSLATIRLPKDLTSIGSEAFRDCSSLASVNFPDNLTSIGSSTFDGCSSLSTIDLPSTLTSIGSYAFRNCSMLSAITLPSTLTSISSYTFDGCSSLSTLDLPSALTSIGSSAFRNCSSLSATLTIDVDGELTVGSNAFNGCSSLTSIIINAGGDVTLNNFTSCPALETFELHTPGKLTATASSLFSGGGTDGSALASLTTVVLDARGEGSKMNTKFYRCKQLTSVTLPSRLTALYNYFFQDCSALTTIDIPSTIATIGNNAFEGCSALEAVDLSHTQITALPNSLFSGCSSLTSILLPNGITSVGQSVFYECSSLESLDLSQIPITDIPYGFCRDCSSLTSVLLPDGITSIGNSAFYNCGLTSFNLTSNGALTIGSDAFNNSKQLADVSLVAAGAMNIGSGAFSYCHNLRNIRFEAGEDIAVSGYPGSVISDCSSLEVFEVSTPGKFDVYTNMFYMYPTNSLRRIWLDARGAGSTIGESAFNGCTQLEELLLPAGLTSIGRYAFYNCTSLPAISLPATTTIAGDGYGMFENCSSLQSIDLSETQITAVGNYAFSGCSKLASVQLPSCFTTISDGMFNGCSLLTTINLPDGLTSIGQQAFRDCSSLPQVNVPASVSTMGEQVFQNCSSLTSATVQADVATLPRYTFDGCSSLRTASLTGNITTIGERAFNGCAKLTDLTLPPTLTTLGQYTFYNCSSLATLSLPSALTTFGDGVFEGCSSLLSLTIPEGVSYLPSQLLYNCTGLQSLYLPSTITEINYSALYNLNSLIDLHVLAATPPSFSYFSRADQVTLFVPEASIADYQTADCWKDFYRIYAELTDLATLDDGEFALLQAIYQKTNGASWLRPWTLGATKAETAMPEGVKVSDGHVVQLALVGNGLRGELPQELLQFPQAWYVNVSHNNLTSDMGAFFDAMTPNSALTHLDLSYNQLRGNIGRMGNGDPEGSLPDEKLPALISLDLSHNQISDVRPVLPAHISRLDLSGQAVNSAEKTYSFSEFADNDVTNFFPSILSYRHSTYRDYGNTLFMLWASDVEEPWAIRIDKHSTGPSSSIFSYSGSGWNFLPSGSTIYLSNLVDNEAERIRIPIIFDFPSGDINYNFDLDIGDLQTLINFALKPESFARYSPFNWAAANTIAATGEAPEVINVQDVVGEVNLLLEQDYDPSLARRHRVNRTYGSTEPCQATIAIEGNQLVLNSEQPVAAIDLTIDGGSVTWSSDLNLFSRKSRGSRTIIYSLMDNVLPAGRTVLGTVGDYAAVRAAQLANAEGALIATAIAVDGKTTGIVSMENGKLKIEDEGIYDLQGRRIDGNLRKGIYLINGKKVIVEK
ncbi:MAG: leucine-rich repeat protein [Prevotella sp.]|nr:leucine-rich repeat protein [Prevotella sp.]